jgi:hypothetical protein
LHVFVSEKGQDILCLENSSFVVGLVPGMDLNSLGESLRVIFQDKFVLA